MTYFLELMDRASFKKITMAPHWGSVSISGDYYGDTTKYKLSSVLWGSTLSNAGINDAYRTRLSHGYFFTPADHMRTPTKAVIAGGRVWGEWCVSKVGATPPKWGSVSIWGDYYGDKTKYKLSSVLYNSTLDSNGIAMAYKTRLFHKYFFTPADHMRTPTKAVITGGRVWGEWCVSKVGSTPAYWGELGYEKSVNDKGRKLTDINTVFMYSMLKDAGVQTDAVYMGMGNKLKVNWLKGKYSPVRQYRQGGGWWGEFVVPRKSIFKPHWGDLGYFEDYEKSPFWQYGKARLWGAGSQSDYLFKIAGSSTALKYKGVNYLPVSQYRQGGGWWGKFKIPNNVVFYFQEEVSAGWDFPKFSAKKLYGMAKVKYRIDGLKGKWTTKAGRSLITKNALLVRTPRGGIKASAPDHFEHDSFTNAFYAIYYVPSSKFLPKYTSFTGECSGVGGKKKIWSQINGIGISNATLWKQWGAMTKGSPRKGIHRVPDRMEPVGASTMPVGMNGVWLVDDSSCKEAKFDPGADIAKGVSGAGKAIGSGLGGIIGGVGEGLGIGGVGTYIVIGGIILVGVVFVFKK